LLVFVLFYCFPPLLVFVLFYPFPPLLVFVLFYCFRHCLFLFCFTVFRYCLFFVFVLLFFAIACFYSYIYFRNWLSLCEDVDSCARSASARYVCIYLVILPVASPSHGLATARS
jgi:hypothetical protein